MPKFRREFIVGQRVRTCIANRNRYAAGAAETLDGKDGVIEAREAVSTNSVCGNGPAYLVRFDEPADSRFAHGAPHTHFWFDPCDLLESSLPMPVSK